MDGPLVALVLIVRLLLRTLTLAGIGIRLRRGRRGCIGIHRRQGIDRPEFNDAVGRRLGYDISRLCGRDGVARWTPYIVRRALRIDGGAGGVVRVGSGIGPGP